MPQKRSSPPPVMTWGKALPVLVVAGIFDAIRIFFEMFWFFGPALAAAYCAIKTSDALSTWTLGVLGAKTAAAVCATTAGIAGTAGVELTAPFGVVMAMAVGLFGFLTLGLWIAMTNMRIFKANAGGMLWFVGGFGISEIPLIGTLPAFTVALWKLYGTQIKVERVAFQKYEAEQAAMEKQERERETAQLMQIQATQAAQAEQEATNAADYIPEESPEAA